MAALCSPRPRWLAAGVACGDFTGVPASLSRSPTAGPSYALNGAPPGAPTALHVLQRNAASRDASFVFDVAFDIDGAGNVVILPQRGWRRGLTSTHTVGSRR